MNTRQSAAVMLTTALGALALAAPPAGASSPVAPGKPLGIAPVAGNDAVVPTLTTSAPCPAATTHAYALVHGGGLPPEGQVVRDVSRLGLSTSSAFTTEATRTWKDVFLAAGTVPAAGEYAVELVCTDELGSRLDRFTAAVVFSAADAYRAADGPPLSDASIAAGSVSEESLTSIDPSTPQGAQALAEALGSTAAPSPAEVAQEPAVPADPQAEPLARSQPVADSGTDDGTDLGPLVGVALLGGATTAALLLGVPALRRRRTTTAPAAERELAAASGRTAP